MSTVADRVADYIREHGLIAPGELVLAAVSGGLDSMCLLELLAGMRDQLGFELTAANFDHGLRGSQGDDERELVAESCRRLGAGFTFGKTAELKELVHQGANLQSEARRLRYAFLWSEADRLGCNRLATGHHRDDQAETVLLRLTQGSTLAGLAGIRPVSHGGRLIRPLLEISRRELEEYAAEKAIRWLEDPSNAGDNYRRNRVRHHLIPAIEREFEPGFTAALASLAEEAAGVRVLLDDAAGKLLAGGVVILEHGMVRADCGELEKQPAVVRRHALRLAVEQLTGGEAILSGRPLAALDSLAVAGHSGRSLDLPGGVTVRREFGTLVLEMRDGQGTAGEAESMELAEGLNSFRAGGTRWELDLLVENGGDIISRFSHLSGEQGATALRQAFDFGRLSLPLTAGIWREGERIELFGGGTKKLKKLFAERRVPVSSRGRVPVVRDNAGQVLWVCGAGRSSAAPVTASTSRVLTIEASQAVIDT